MTTVGLPTTVNRFKDQRKSQQYTVNHKETWQFIFDYNFG